MLPPLLFCTSSSFSFLSLPLLLLLHVLFLSWSDGSSGVKRRWSSTGHAMFLSSILSFSMTERERERDRPRTSASRSTFLSSLRVRFSSSSRFRVLSLRLFVKNRSRGVYRCVQVGFRRLDREKAGTNRIPEGRRLYSVGDRHETAFCLSKKRTSKSFHPTAGSNFRLLDGSRDTRTENTKPCCLAHLERWLSSGDNDTTYRDTR